MPSSSLVWLRLTLDLRLGLMYLLVTVCFCVDYGKKYTFTGGWGGWEEKWGLKLTSAKVEVEVEAELCKMLTGKL